MHLNYKLEFLTLSSLIRRCISHTYITNQKIFFLIISNYIIFFLYLKLDELYNFLPSWYAFFYVYCLMIVDPNQFKELALGIDLGKLTKLGYFYKLFFNKDSFWNILRRGSILVSISLLLLAKQGHVAACRAFRHCYWRNRDTGNPSVYFAITNSEILSQYGKLIEHINFKRL